MSSADLFLTTFGRAAASTAYAPGRIEFIGNHTDYNGGSVLGAAVDRGIHVSMALRQDRAIHLTSGDSGQIVVTSLDTLWPQLGSDSWINYPLGVVAAALADGMPVKQGFEWAATTDLPAGAGMSSSAALELSTLCALAALHGCESPDRAWMAALCRRAENDFVGVPCGILDQGVSAFGEENHLVHIDCHTEIFSTQAMPEGVHFWIFNTHKKHALLDSKYSERHRECGEALAILSNYDAATPCLARMEPALVREHAGELGPVLTRRAQHVTEENQRVAETCAALEAGDTAAVGRLLTESHGSSRELFENSVPELDFLVDQLTSLPSVYGARLTGGGFGGAVMALTDEAFAQASETTAIAAAFQARFGSEPDIFHTTAGAGAHLCT